jgi:membrane fusion protein (multidrug efflux system)
MTVIPGAALLVGAYFFVTGQRFVTSENAFVKANMVAISTEIAGKVTAVEIGEHAFVRAGQILFRIDDAPYRIALDETKASMQWIRNEVESLRAAYRVKQAETRLAADDLAYFERSFKRRQKLLLRGNVSQERFDQARRNRDSARQKITILRQEINQILTGLSGDPDLKVEDYPKYRRARAAFDRASLDLERTVIRAPTSGRVSKVTLEPGEFVKVAVPLFAIISDRTIWIEVNLKETQLTHVRLGQAVTVEIDAYPDVIWRATVDSISPATGAEFAILPPQNATGNWVKVVQRLPVRLAFEDAKGGPELRAGMSAAIEIDTQYEAVLPGFIQEALAWVRPKE